MTAKKQLSFHVLVEQRDDAFVATCLEMSLVAASLDEDDVVSKISKLINRQLEFAIKHNRLADIYHSAPEEVFRKYVFDKGHGLCSGQRSLSFDHSGGLLVNQTAYATANC